MAFAITQTCCRDATCVSVCPVNCIHPTPEEPGFGDADMLYVDPRSCIDCGACADACPVDAIFPVEKLTEPLRPYAEVNADYYADAPAAAATTGPNFHRWGPPVFDRNVPGDLRRLDVAVVGTGPAGMYATQDLLLHTNSRVTLIDRLPNAGGLMRYGVAPDHGSTRKIGDAFTRFHRHPRVRLQLGTEVGRDVTVAELATRHDAVIYAVGAAAARRLGVPGEDLPGSVAATTVVAWYNGHPDVPAETVELPGERVAVVGTGNVALDVARILTTDPDSLADTAIAPGALARLRTSRVREVVLLGRRGPAAAAYSAAELRALIRRDDLDLVVDTHDPSIAEEIDATGDLLRCLPRETVDWTVPPRAGRPRIVLRFRSTPTELLGDTRVDAVRVSGQDGDVTIPVGTVVSSIGYRGTALPGLPFDDRTGTVPHDLGRVRGAARAYVVGWIKRGPSGGIGTNRFCAKETVTTLLTDLAG